MANLETSEKNTPTPSEALEQKGEPEGSRMKEGNAGYGEGDSTPESFSEQAVELAEFG